MTSRWCNFQHIAGRKTVEPRTAARFTLHSLRRVAAWTLLLAVTFALPSALSAEPANEIYQSVGYGYILEIEPATESPREIAIYVTTESSLLEFGGGLLDREGRFFSFDADGESQYLGRLIFRGDGVELQSVDKTQISFERLQALPEAVISEPTTDPTSSFQVAWELVEQYFSLFPILDVNWQAHYDRLAPRVDSTTSRDELFEVLSEMLAPLNDGHTALVARDLERFYSPGPRFGSEWAGDRVAEILQVIAQHTDDGLTAPIDNVLFGSMGDFGYLAVSAMFLEGVEGPQWEFVFGAAIDAALSALSDKQGLILDLRLNPGGSDHISLALAERLTDQTRLAYRKAPRVGAYDEYGEMQEIYYSPKGMHWGSRPVAVLTSRNTASAADVAAMVLGDLPNVTLIGEPTHGIFSDAYSYPLPNGWSLTTSTETYLSSHDVNYEQIGYPADIPVSWSENALDVGRDNILERALTFLTSTLSSCAPSSTTLCLQDGRFAVQVEWRDFQGGRGTGRALPVNDEFGHFWFFDEDNVELAIKVLDGRAVNQAFWVFFGSLSNVEFTITVTDTETGTSKVYENPLGGFASVGDTTAFPNP